MNANNMGATVLAIWQFHKWIDDKVDYVHGGIQSVTPDRAGKNYCSVGVSLTPPASPPPLSPRTQNNNSFERPESLQIIGGAVKT